MKKLRIIIGSAALVVSGLSLAQPAAAVDIYKACSSNDSVVCEARNESVDFTIQQGIRVLLSIAAIISVIMIIIGGIKYTTSNGDASKVASAKNTIMYAVIGLVISAAALAIVQYVNNNISAAIIFTHQL